MKHSSPTSSEEKNTVFYKNMPLKTFKKMQRKIAQSKKTYY